MRELLERKWAKAALAILLAFAVGLVGFYLFSAEYGDGLESTMDGAGVEESEPAFGGILGYGDSYIASLAMGIIGFLATLAAVYLLARLMRKNDA